MIIIGSTAIKHHFPDFPREPQDLDYAVLVPYEGKKEKWVEYLVNPVIYNYQDSYTALEPSLILTLKMSHMFWDIKWYKHLFDIQFLINKGVEYNLDILRELRDYWEETKPKVKRSELATSKEDFFTNSVNKDTDEHDLLHEIINPIPMFSRLLKEDAEVELDENKWDFLKYEDRLEVVREETMVMAYERYHHKSVHYIPAFRKQLKDNIIKHFPEYIAIFAILNYPELENPKYNYYKKIEDGLKKN